MTEKNKALWVGGLTFALTLLVTILKNFEGGYAKGNWLIWTFCAWNYFAYGFERQMIPWVWVELKGHGQGHRTERKVVFWVTALIYLAFLTLAAFSGK